MKKVLALAAIVAFAGSLFAQTPVKKEAVKAPAKKEAKAAVKKEAAKPEAKKVEKPAEKKAEKK